MMNIGNKSIIKKVSRYNCYINIGAHYCTSASQIVCVVIMQVSYNKGVPKLLFQIYPV
jgi:hypothetical protein